MKNWPHQILDELLSNYSETTSDLTRFTITTLKIDSKDRIKAEKIKDILDQLEKRNYIWWKVLKPHVDIKSNQNVWIENFEYKKNFGLYVKGVEETLDNNRVEAQLTIEGLDYAINLRREREQHESIISTNQSVETTNKSTRNLNEKILPNNFRSQRTGNRWSRILAGISVAFIAITAFLQYHDKSAQKTQELKQEVKETSKTLKEVKTSLQEINYSMKNVTTDTILVRRRK